jgi:TorA maturation chaperone TorD
MIAVQGHIQVQAAAPEPTPADDSAIMLRGQLVVYDLLRRLFLIGPSPDLLQAIAAVDRAGLDLPKYLDHDLGQVQEAVNANLERLESWSESLIVEFTRLMVGPGETPVVPYGSFYLSPTRSLMTEETLAVREFFLGAGLVVENLHRIPDDHLGIELEFLYWLTQQMAEWADDGDRKARDRFLNLRDSFIRDHYSKWVPEFADALDRATSEPFFRVIASVLKSTCLSV